MATLRIEINMENDAFYESRELEVANILFNYADRVRKLNIMPDRVALKDLNGNTVGAAEIIED